METPADSIESHQSIASFLFSQSKKSRCCHDRLSGPTHYFKTPKQVWVSWNCWKPLVSCRKSSDWMAGTGSRCLPSSECTCRPGYGNPVTRRITTSSTLTIRAPCFLCPDPSGPLLLFLVLQSAFACCILHGKWFLFPLSPPVFQNKTCSFPKCVCQKVAFCVSPSWLLFTKFRTFSFPYPVAYHESMGCVTSARLGPTKWKSNELNSTELLLRGALLKKKKR